MESTVIEIHEYPLRPDGYEEPLFSDADKNREVMEHFLQAPWLDRASEYAVQTTGYFSGSGRSGRALAEPLEVGLFKERGRTVMRLGPCGGHGQKAGSLVRRRVRRCSVRSGAIRRVVESWREVCGWWEEGGGLDFVVYRVELSYGAVVDLAHDRSGDRLGRNEDAEETDSCEPGVGRWLLVGMMD